MYKKRGFIRITQSYDSSKYMYENMTGKMHSMPMAYLVDEVVDDLNTNIH